MNGAIWYSTSTATVLLVVRDGVVVDGPPYARHWAIGRRAADVWLEGYARGVRLTWLN